MKAYLDRWSVEQLGPAFSTRREEADGSVSYEALHTVSLTFTVVGNDASEFLDTVKQLTEGATIQSIQLAPTGTKNEGRKYVFSN